MILPPPVRPAARPPGTGSTILYPAVPADQGGAPGAAAAAPRRTPLVFAPGTSVPGRDEVPGVQQHVEPAPHDVDADQSAPGGRIGHDLDQVTGGDHRQSEGNDDDPGSASTVLSRVAEPVDDVVAGDEA